MNIYYLFITKSNVLSILISVLLTILLFLCGYLIYQKITKKVSLEVSEVTTYKRKNGQLVLKIAESSILVALAVVFELIFKAIPFLNMPQGGSASLSMLPLFILAYRRGVSWGVVGGALYSIVNLLIDGGLYHWGSLFLDYLLAFSCIGLAGFFRKLAKNNSFWLCVGCFTGVLGRYLFTSLSGVLIFGEYAEPGMNVWYYSFIYYNLPYMMTSMIMCMIVLVAIKRIIFFNID